MHPDELKRVMEMKRLQLEARDQAQWRKARRKYRVQSNLEPVQPQQPKKEEGDNTGAQPTTTFLDTWDTMYRRRMSRDRGTALFALPESLLDAGIKTLELLIGKLVTKLLK
jgi:hypothetical protein